MVDSKEDIIRSEVKKDQQQAMYGSSFEIHDKVWLQNPMTGWFEWWMQVVARRYDKNKEGWEYQVKDPRQGEGVLYNQGEWVLERYLRDG